MRDSRRLLNELWPDYTGETRICYRCGETLPIFVFQDPVTLCMPCYQRIPGNREMNWEQLREKARKSRWARKKNEINERQEALRNIAISYGAKPLTEKPKESIILRSYDSVVCEQCGKETTSYDTHAVGLGGVKILCSTCMPVHSNKKKGK